MSMKERQAALNHRLKAVRNDEADEGSSFGCECADLRCNARLELTGEERSRSRVNSSQFWVKPGHELDNEQIVETQARFCVVKLEAQPFYVVSAPS
jgi:hypothetical protein